MSVMPLNEEVVMAAICRQKSGNFRVQFRVKGLKLISRTFTTEAEAITYQTRITSELDTIQNIQQNKLPIDTAEKLGVTITRFDKPHDICKTIIKITQASGKNVSGLTERFSVYTEIIKYWRDAGMHHSKWDIDADRANFALDTLLSMCYFVRDKWFL